MNKPDIIDKIIISQEEIKEINKRIFGEIFTYYKNNIKSLSKIINVIVVLQGAKNFYEDLFTKKISTDEIHDPYFQISFIRVKSYEGTESSEEILIDFGDIIPEKDITDKHILIIDDIYDTGKTLSSIVKRIKKYNPGSLKCCVLIERNIEHEKEVDVKFVGKKIGTKEFLIGYGLDYNGEYRELSYVGTMKKEMKYDNIAPITPNNCLICGSKYSGGATYKGEPMKEGARIFFKCGSMSFKKLDEGIFQLLVKCTKESEIEHKNNEREKKNKSN